MRTLLIVAVVGWVLRRAHASGNYFFIRWYLWSLLATALGAAAHRLGGGTSSDAEYWLIYSVGTACILVGAWLASVEMMLRNPWRRFLVWVPLAAGALGFAYGWVPESSPTSKLLLVQGVVLTVTSLNIILSAPLVTTLRDYVLGRDIAMRTLGYLFMAQAAMFYLMSVGWNVAPERWGAIGEWLPTILPLLFLLRVGMHLYPDAPPNALREFTWPVVWAKGRR